MCLFVFKFPFVEDKVFEVFDGVLVDIFHEGFDGCFWELRGSEFVNGVFVYCTSYSCCNCNEGVSNHCFVWC